MQNPVTGSGGMLTGTVDEVGPASPLGLTPGQRIATLVSLTLTPLQITDGLAAWDGQSEQVPCEGHAILFARSIAAVLPDDLPTPLALAVMDVCGAPALTSRVVTEGDLWRQRGLLEVVDGAVVLVVGAAGKSGSLSAAAARQAGAAKIIGVVPSEAEAVLLRNPATTQSPLVDAIVIADARDPVGLAEKVEAAGGPADVTVVCVDVAGCEGGAILSTKQGGTVIFFSMATSVQRSGARRRGPSRRCDHAGRKRVRPGPRGPRAGPYPDHAIGAAVVRNEGGSMTGKLNLDPALVAQARELARLAGQPVTDLARTHTTVSVERAVLRLGGLDGADEDGMPWVNRLTDAVRESVGLEHGVALPAWDALLAGGYPDLRTLAVDAGSGLVKFRLPMGADADAARESAARSVRQGLDRIDAQRAERDRMVAATSDPPMPWIYLIVATGDIYEDIPQAQAAAREGADVIAVIRSTGQSLLDYVPEGATREGYAGTYATRENFRLMRGALDDVSRELGRYVRLTNYASGLCMPEIASLAGLERLDMMLNDCMYGIIFRDINPVRTFIDQRFSRQVHARAGIVINTGEDNYLTTADAVDAAHTVVVSQLLNEYFGREAGLADGQLGLGHAFEINPEVPDSFLLELAHAQLIRELFPDAPLKYMPPTKHMTGNVFAGYLLDAFFNLAGVMTDQSILLIGMMTEGIHTPFLSDRDLALENVRYVRRAAGRLGESFRPEPDGFVAQRARQVLGEAIDLLGRIGSQGLLTAIGEGTFGVTRRPADGGRGLDGVVKQAGGYYNPATQMLEATS